MQTNAHFIIYQQKLFPLFEHIKSSIVFYSLYTILPPLKNMFYNTKYNFQTYSLAYFKKKQYLCCRFESIRLRLVLSTIGLYIQNRRLYALKLVLEIRSFKHVPTQAKQHGCHEECVYATHSLPVKDKLVCSIPNTECHRTYRRLRGRRLLSFSYRLPTYRERQEKKGGPAYRKIVRLNIFGVDAVARFRLDGYCETSSTERTTSCPRFLYAYIRAPAIHIRNTIWSIFGNIC